MKMHLEPKIMTARIAKKRVAKETVAKEEIAQARFLTGRSLRERSFIGSSLKDRSVKQSILKLLLAASLLGGSLLAQATTVQIQTLMGDFEVNLYDKTTPKTVANFLAYANSGAYSNSIIHRSVPGFIVQGGGFTYDSAWPAVAIPQQASVLNEPVYANVRGTIAMAKLGNNANSATNQWFINLADNSANLDNQNGGFTVFGQVTGNGMAIVDAIAALKPRNKTGVFSDLPLRNYSDADQTAGLAIDDDHLVMITGVVVLNASADTADGLTPKKTTRKSAGDGGSSGGNSGGSGGSSGGSFGALTLLALLGFGFLTRTRRTKIR